MIVELIYIKIITNCLLLLYKVFSQDVLLRAGSGCRLSTLAGKAAPDFRDWKWERQDQLVDKRQTGIARERKPRDCTSELSGVG